MDVQSWLQRIADRAPPDPSDEDLGIPAFPAHPHRTRSDAGRPTAPHKSRRKRQRASSDSSIVAPRSASRSPRHVAHAPPFAELARGTGRRRSGSAPRRESSEHSSADQSPSEVEEVAPKKSYERRARHKTKTDRYEPKAKKLKSKHDEQVEEPRPKKRRKARGTNNGERTAELVQNFALKNGLPKSKRLTLKADESKRGLFKHGRSSDQKVGRGTGLPDLVFNEMRFLQRPQDHQDEPAAKEPDKKRSRGDDRNRKQQEEISAYFVDKKTKDHKVADHTRANTNPSKPHGDRHRDRSGSRARQPNRKIEAPPVEFPEKPFLGFGSRGARPSSRCSNGSSTPYSWSESQQRRSPVNEVQQSCTLRQTHNQPPSRQQKPDASHRRRRTDPGLHLQGAVTDAGSQKHSLAGLAHQPQVTNIPSSAPTYEQAVPKPLGKDGGHPGVGTATPSLPSLTIFDRQSHRAGNGTHDNDDSLQPYDRTSDILRVRLGRLGPDAAVSRTRQEGCLALDLPEEDAPSSSPTSKLLRQAEDASYRPLGLLEPNLVPLRRGEARLDDRQAEAHQPLVFSRTLPDIEPQVRASPKVASLPSRSLQPASTTARDHQSRESFPLPSRSLHLEPWQIPHQCPTNALIDGEDEEMLDNGNTEPSLPDQQYHRPATTYHAESSEAVPSTSSKLTRVSLPLESDRGSHAASARLAAAFDAGSRGLLTSAGLVPLSVPESGVVGRLDDMAGFWKPHRLY